MIITIVRGGGGGQRVMIEIIIRVNDENDGRPLNPYEHIGADHPPTQILTVEIIGRSLI